jgi:hypothetical protein
MPSLHRLSTDALPASTTIFLVSAWSRKMSLPVETASLEEGKIMMGRFEPGTSSWGGPKMAMIGTSGRKSFASLTKN